MDFADNLQVASHCFFFPLLFFESQNLQLSLEDYL